MSSFTETNSVWTKLAFHFLDSPWWVPAGLTAGLFVWWAFVSYRMISAPERPRKESQNSDESLNRHDVYDEAPSLASDPTANKELPSILSIHKPLYVGHILVSEITTLEDFYIELTLLLFNPNAHIVTLYTSGVLEITDVHDPSFQAPFTNLPAPSIRNGAKIEALAESEVALTLWQQFKAKDAEKIRERYFSGSSLQLSLRKYQVVTEHDGKSAEEILWSAVGFQKPPEKMPWVTRSVDVNVIVSAGTLRLS